MLCTHICVRKIKLFSKCQKRHTYKQRKKNKWNLETSTLTRLKIITSCCNQCKRIPYRANIMHTQIQ